MQTTFFGRSSRVCANDLVVANLQIHHLFDDFIIDFS